MAEHRSLWLPARVALVLLLLLSTAGFLSCIHNRSSKNKTGLESLSSVLAASISGSYLQLLNSSRTLADNLPLERQAAKQQQHLLHSQNQSQAQPNQEEKLQRRKKSYRRLLYGGKTCTYKDISISQSREGSSGIPQFNVQIVNTCLTNCAPTDIHVFCGWFASAPLVNPNVFRRLAFDDCLVNGGRPLKHGDIIRFAYSNSFMYPLRFRSAKFC